MVNHANIGLKSPNRLLLYLGIQSSKQGGWQIVCSKTIQAAI